MITTIGRSNSSPLNILRYVWVLVVFLMSCDAFLDIEPPKSVIKKNDVFNDPITADLAVIGIYSSLNEERSFASGSATSISTICGLSADELVNVPRTDAPTLEFEQNDLDARNARVLELWSSAYRTIYMCNSALEGLENSTALKMETKDQLMGEVFFIRAFCHFYLVNLFGDVPLITSTDYEVNSKVSRDLKAAVYSQIVDDLQKAKDILPITYIGNGKVRVTWYAATSMLARVYLYLDRWPDAEAEASLIIDNPLFRLVALDSVFLANSKEAIWQLRPAQIITQNGSTKEADIFIPPTVMSYNAVSPSLATNFESDDNRHTKWIGKFGSIYHPFKYRQSSSNQPMTEFSMVLRLAEQYFIRAEARMHNGNINGLNSAQSDLNTIRDRAGLPGVADLTMDEMVLAIESERKHELFTEWGHRWFDLKRTNRADAVLDPIKTKWSLVDMLYPIPQLERNNNPNLNPQNPGY